MTFEELESEALKLPIEDRAQLAFRLVLSLAGEIEPDSEGRILGEIERRFHERFDGKVGRIPIEQALDRILAYL